MAGQYIPSLSYFQFQNLWSGSAGPMNYHITPTQDGDEERVLRVEIWEGPWEYDLSTVEETKTFPLSEEGLRAIPAYLEERRAAIQARPRRTLAQEMARRKR